jgi:hypothetical protein
MGDAVLGRRSPQPPSIKRPWDVPPPPPRGENRARIFSRQHREDAFLRPRRAPPTSIFKVIFRSADSANFSQLKLSWLDGLARST